MKSLNDLLKEPENVLLLKNLKLENWASQLEASVEKFAQIFRKRGDDLQKIKNTSSAT